MNRTGRSRVSAITQTPACGPPGPPTTPPMSSGSMATEAACCCARGAMNNTRPMASDASARVRMDVFMNALLDVQGILLELAPLLAGELDEAAKARVRGQLLA